MHAVAVNIREYLDLDVPRFLQILLEQNGIVAEARLRFAPRGGERRGKCVAPLDDAHALDRKSTRLNSSHVKISYAVCCLKKKKNRRARGGVHGQHNRGGPHRRRGGPAARGRVPLSPGGDAGARRRPFLVVFFFNDPATTEIYTLSLHDALPI